MKFGVVTVCVCHLCHCYCYCDTEPGTGQGHWARSWWKWAHTHTHTQCVLLTGQWWLGSSWLVSLTKVPVGAGSILDNSTPIGTDVDQTLSQSLSSGLKSKVNYSEERNWKQRKSEESKKRRVKEKKSQRKEESKKRENQNLSQSCFTKAKLGQRCDK